MVKKTIVLLLTAMICISFSFGYERDGYGGYNVPGGILSVPERIHYVDDTLLGVDDGPKTTQKERNFGNEWIPSGKAYTSYETDVEWIPQVTDFVDEITIKGFCIEEKDGLGGLYITLYAFDGKKMNPFTGSVFKNNISPYGYHSDYPECPIEERYEVNGNTVSWGYLPMEEMEDVNLRGFVDYGNYVLCVYMTNLDDFPTKEQKEVFFEVLEKLAEQE